MGVGAELAEGVRDRKAGKEDPALAWGLAELKEGLPLPNLVDIMGADDGVKERVEVIEQVYHFDGLTHGGDGGEAHDVAEVQSHLLKILGLHRCPRLQSLGHRTRDVGEGGGPR